LPTVFRKERERGNKGSILWGKEYPFVDGKSAISGAYFLNKSLFAE
jgi:hypothetical protein